MEPQQNDETSNAVPGISGFGGHLLSAQTQNYGAEALGVESSDDVDTMVANLAALGIEDAEQVVALAAVPGIKEELDAALGNASLQTLLDQIHASLPAERIALVNKPATEYLALGVLPATPEMVDAAEASAVTASAEMLGPVALPASVNLIPFMSPIRNQASRGTCVAFTLTALNEYILRRRGLVRDLSEQHLYFETKQIDGASASCGTWQSKAVLALQSRGQCREAVWPYNPNPPCNNHGPLPAAARPDGLNYRLTTIAVPARNVAAYKDHMSKQRPVTLSIPVYDSWYRSAETYRSGRITMRVGNEPAVGGHAVCLVGYQDTPTSPGGGYFIVRNSWNGSFGTASPYGVGYGTIPYQYITNDATEAYTAAVPGIQTDAPGDEQEQSSTSTVTIDVKPNVTITISAS